MKKLRSVLSIVLVIAMVLSLLPHSVPRTHAEGQRMEVTIQKYGYEMSGENEKIMDIIKAVTSDDVFERFSKWLEEGYPEFSKEVYEHLKNYGL